MFDDQRGQQVFDAAVNASEGRCPAWRIDDLAWVTDPAHTHYAMLGRVQYTHTDGRIVLSFLVHPPRLASATTVTAAQIAIDQPGQAARRTDPEALRAALKDVQRRLEDLGPQLHGAAILDIAAALGVIEQALDGR